MTARLKDKFNNEIVPLLIKKWGLNNKLQIPRLVKIVINIGLSEVKDNIKVLDIAMAEVAAIAGQKPMICRSKKAISNFKIREGMPIGIKVTLRSSRMYEFLDRLISIAIPQVKDFRGLNRKAFDGRGNYNLGLSEQYIFPEVDIEKSDKARGMNITIVTTAGSDEKALDFLSLFGMPFKKID